MTFGTIIGNRGFFPDHLAKTGREELLAVIDKMGPPLSESRGDIEKLMHQNKCGAAADTETDSAPEAAPAEPAQPSTAPETSDAPKESPAAGK